MIQDFPNGLLYLPQEPFELSGGGETWFNNPVTTASLIITVLLLVLFIKDFFVLFYPTLGCLTRWKPNLEMEHSIQLARTRNRIAILVILPIVLMAYRFDLSRCNIFVSLGCLIGYLLVRKLIHMALPAKKIDSESYLAVSRVLYTFSIPLAVLMMVSVGLWMFIRWSDEAMRIVLLCEIGLAWFLAFIREWQILAFQCRPFRAFLYLCALEILPMAGLITVFFFTA